MLWMAFGPFVIYPPSGFIDPWIYTGYFTNFHYLVAHNGFTYYVSRLPSILPGRLAFVCGQQNVNQGLATGDMGKLYDLSGNSKTIVHLTSHPERIAQRSQLMAARGVLLGNQRHTTIDYDGKPFTVVLQDVIRDSRMRH